jgi:hypothetical protein
MIFFEMTFLWVESLSLTSHELIGLLFSIRSLLSLFITPWCHLQS